MGSFPIAGVVKKREKEMDEIKRKVDKIRTGMRSVFDIMRKNREHLVKTGAKSLDCRRCHEEFPVEDFKRGEHVFFLCSGCREIMKYKLREKGIIPHKA